MENYKLNDLKMSSYKKLHGKPATTIKIIKQATEDIPIFVTGIGEPHDYPFPTEKGDNKNISYGLHCNEYFCKITNIVMNTYLTNHPYSLITKTRAIGETTIFENSIKCHCGCNEYFDNDIIFNSEVSLLSDNTKTNLKLFKEHLFNNQKLRRTEIKNLYGYNKLKFLTNNNILCHIKCSKYRPEYTHFTELLDYAFVNERNIRYLYHYNPLRAELSIIDMDTFDKTQLALYYTTNNIKSLSGGIVIHELNTVKY